jgi:uncharacterized protein involved in exopolysaccharide biosynthesis
MDSENDLESEELEASAAKAVSPLELLRFVVRAARRHVKLGIIVAVGVAICGLVAAQSVPQKYEAASRIFVDETATKTEALSSPDRALPNLDPMSGTFELVKQKRNLVSMVEQTGLLESWMVNRQALLRWKDKLVSWVSGSPTAAEKRDALAKMLNECIFLMRDKNLVTIRVIWTNPTITYKLAKLVQSKLVESVRERETASYSSAISILEEEAKRADAAIEPALAEAVRARAKAAKARGQTLAPESGAPRSFQGSAASAPIAPSAGTSPEKPMQSVATKLTALAAKMQAAEEPWRRRQLELNARLTELRAVYGEEHPEVVKQEALIRATSEPPAEVVELRKMRADLLNSVETEPSAKPAEDTKTPATARPRVVTRTSSPVAFSNLTIRDAKAEIDEDPAVTAARAELNRTIEEYSRVSKQLASARLQFTTAQVAFNTRYVVTAEPEFPSKPTKPIRTIVTSVAVAAALLFGFLAGALRDLASGRIHEPWQAELLGLKTLGELHMSRQMLR